ncbi:MAG: hypothetical protein KDB60_02170, partial [Propionibacteriaceae bacterium]|nr:hypothetical protein [Propionibacteriaceae bacterium]
GRVVAVKVRRASARLDACTTAHRTAHEAGIDCPAPLAGPAPMSDDPQLAVLAETWRADGAIWPSEDPPGNYGRLQAALVTALAGIDPAPFTPPPAWLRYDHRAAGRLWPPVTAARRDPEDVQYELPPGLAGYAHAARERLLAASLPAVVGHAALSGLHVRWLDGPKGAPVAVVHGWEELAARPEAALVGCLAASFNELPDQPRIAPVVEGERVLAAYQAASGRTFTTEEVEVAWAASAWVACYTAAMEHVSGAPGQATHQVVTDGQLRLHLAGC